MPPRSSKGADMSESIAPARTTESSTETVMEAVRPTGYRLSILPRTLELSARLTTTEELENLVKVLKANAVIWANETKATLSDPVMEVSEEDLRTLRKLWSRSP